MPPPAGNVVGLTVKLELLDDTVRLPVVLEPVTVKVLVAVLPLITVPNVKAVTLVLIVGSAEVVHVPLTLTVLLVAPPPLMVIVPTCVPVAVGLYITVTLPPLAVNVVGLTVKLGLLEVTVKLPVKSVPVTLNDWALAVPTVASLNVNEDGLTEIEGSIAVP